MIGQAGCAHLLQHTVAVRWGSGQHTLHRSVPEKTLLYQAGLTIVLQRVGWCSHSNHLSLLYQAFLARYLSLPLLNAHRNSLFCAGGGIKIWAAWMCYATSGGPACKSEREKGFSWKQNPPQTQ